MTSDIRRVWSPVALSAVVITAAVMAGSAQPVARSTDVHEILTAGNFTVDIQGIDSADAVSAEVDPIEIEMHEVTESNDTTWKQFVPGAVRFGEARFTFRTSDAALNEDLTTWVDSRVDAPKTIRVVILFKNGRPGRRYTLVDCLPVRFAPSGGMYLINRVCPRCLQSDNLAELTVKIGSIKIDDGSRADARGGAEANSVTNADQILRYKGFNVEIKNAGEASGEIDSSWGEVRGGAVVAESMEVSVDPNGERTFTPGKSYVTDITLTGYLTPDRHDMVEWMNRSITRGDNGAGDLRADVTITPQALDGTPAPSHSYWGSLITRIKIPSLNSGSSEPVEEKVTLRPTRRNDPS